MIHVVAIITTKPGMRDQVLQAFHANVAATKAEPGCIEYGAAIDLESGLSFQSKCGSDTFVVQEKWESMAALKAHAGAPHMKAFGAAVKGMMVGQLIHLLSPVKAD